MVWQDRDTRAASPLDTGTVARSLLLGNRLPGTGLSIREAGLFILMGEAATGYVRCLQPAAQQTFSLGLDTRPVRQPQRRGDGHAGALTTSIGP